MVKTKFKKAVSLMLAAVMSLTAFTGHTMDNEEDFAKDTKLCAAILTNDSPLF